MSTGAAAIVVMATVVPASAASSPPCTTDGTCALILGGTSIPTPDDYYVDVVRKHFIEPTHPGQMIGYDAVTTPEELWPVTGFARLLGLAVGPPELFGPSGPGWPNEPWWKLSGLFDLTADQSLHAGVADLDAAIAAHPNQPLVIYGLSQGAGVANAEKRKLAEQYPGPGAPDIDFVLSGDPNLPNGGIASRFAGLYIPILDFSFNGPAPTDTQFDTVEINRQYDGFSDFPLYPLNVVADLNAILGIAYVHLYSLDVSLPTPDPTASPAYQGTHGDTSYYFFQTNDLPLFGPLRTLGVPEKYIDVVEPVFKVIVDLGYDRSIPPWEPTPARLVPRLNPETVATDLVDAIGEGIDNAAALIGTPAPLSIPAAPTPTDRDASVEEVSSPPRVTHDNLEINNPTVRRELAATRDQITETIGAVKSVIGNGRTVAHPASGDNSSNSTTTSPARKTPVRDAATKASSDIKKVVTKAADNVKKALGGARDKAASDQQ